VHLGHAISGSFAEFRHLCEATAAPTEAPQVPELPVFDPADTAFDIIASTPAVTELPAQLPATPAPTPFPTYSGYVSVAVEKEVAIVKATMGFPLTQAQATNLVMKLAIEDGVANSLGLDGDLVKIVSAGGVKVRRRLVEDLAIAFEIQSPAGADTAQADVLKSNLATAATSGALVTHVQAEAASAGVLVESLKSMTAALPAPAIEIATKSITVFEQQRPGKTHVNNEVGNEGIVLLEVFEIVGIAGCVVLIVILLVTHVFKRKQHASKSTPSAVNANAKPVSESDVAIVDVPVSQPVSRKPGSLCL
jgi:hypothetical protein